MPFLREMLYEAIYTRPGEPRPGRDILDAPGIARYIAGWGRPGDRAFIAEQTEDGWPVGVGQPIGIAWYRLFPEEAKGYGYVAGDVPELSVAVVPTFRGLSIGTDLMHQLLRQAEKDGYRGLSLSVDPHNPAVRLYERLGFSRTGMEGTSWTMLRLFW